MKRRKNPHVNPFEFLLTESATSHSITVEATDGDIVRSQSFTINVTNVNELNAITDTDADANSVAENSANGTVVQVTANAVDPEGDTVTYSLTDDAGGRFAIDPTTGIVTVNGLLDFESATSHSITVEATDGDIVRSQSFTINVTDVVENLAPTDLILSNNTVQEDSLNGTVVGTLTTVDPDDVSGFTYILTDSANGRFAVNATTGQVTVADTDQIDFETATSHTITAQVTDNDGASFSEVFYHQSHRRYQRIQLHRDGR